MKETTMLHSFVNLLAGILRPRGHRLGRKPGRTTLVAAGRKRFRPSLEALEDRCVPATWTVTNLLDSGPGSLRYEIGQAQNGDIIDFASDVRGTITLNSGEL